MDPNGHIYIDDEDKIPAEDKARLDGYLRGRAESDAEKIAAIQEEATGSEFGAGIVVCLAKFSEHLQEHGPYSERAIRQFAKWTPERRGRAMAEAKRYPKGDSARMLSEMEIFESLDSPEEAISSAIEIWMNSASDHFYDLDDRAPEPLKELASLTLRIGHGFTGERWTVETADRIRELWRESCLAVDRMLGVEPDWGSL